MEVEEEAVCKKKLDEQTKNLQRQMRELEKMPNLDPGFRDRQKEIWKEELQEIERKRTELLLEHQKMQREEVTKYAELAGQAKEQPQERLLL